MLSQSVAEGTKDKPDDGSASEQGNESKSSRYENRGRSDAISKLARI